MFCEFSLSVSVSVSLSLCASLSFSLSFSLSVSLSLCLSLSLSLSGVGGSLLQQQAPFSLQVGMVSSQSKPDFSLPSGSSLSFGTASTGFTAPQQQPSQFGAGAVMPTLTGLTQTTNTNTGFNFAQFSSAVPQFQFGQTNALPPTTTNTTVFLFGSGSNANTSAMTGTRLEGREIKKAVRRRR